MAAATQGWTDAGQAKAVTVAQTDATQKWIGWGSGTTAFAVGQTTLVSAHPESRTSGTISVPAANTYKVVGSITATGTRTVEEVAIFDASTSGNMIVRGTHAAYNVVAGDIVTYDIRIVHKDSSE